VQEELTKQQRKAQKAQRRLEKELNNIQPVADSFLGKVNVLCVRFGNKYSIEYVNRLRNMVQRHLTIPYNFYCLTDDPTPIRDVELIVRPNSGYARGWWHKVHMFDTSLPISGRILYMDLDVVIHNSMNKLVTVFKDDFIGIRDFNKKFYPAWKNLNSSVLAWNSGTQGHIYKQFVDNPSLAMKLHGDQDWIWKTSKDRIKFWPDAWIQSYKWEIRSKEELVLVQGKRRFKTINNNINPNPDCCIAVFHGDPNPSEVQDQFVLENWK
jgi:hypothetical protein